MMEILEKIKFIQKCRKELNEQNQYALKFRERARLKIERKVALKFLIVTVTIFIFICLSNYFFNNLINDWVASIYVKYINFPLSDEDSARYFFSAVPQSLAALLAISFTVLLIYLQISVDRYSIQTVRYVFHGWGAVTVLSIFLTTIIYSFFELCNIRNMGVEAFPWNCAICTTFILTILCGLLLISFFYKTISSLTPENFIRQSSERIKKAFIITLDFTQLIRIKNTFFKNKINDMENVEEPHFFIDFGLSDSKHCIKTSKRGFVQDIDVFKIDKCSKLLSSVSDDCKLQLKIPIEGKVSSASNVLGFIECSNSEIIQKVERLVKKAYKIDNKKTWMIEDYNELEPLSSLTTKAIKDFEKGIAETALRELTDTIIEYIKVRKDFGLMPSFKQDEGIRFGRYFIDESYTHLEKIMKVCMKESDPDIMDLMFYLNMIIGNESITLQDSDTFKKVIRFYLYFSHRLEDDFIDTILLNSGSLELKTRYDLEKEKEDIDYIKGSESILKEIADYYRDLTKILMDKQTRFAITSLEKHFEMNNGMDRLRYNTAEFQLKMKLRELEPECNEYQKIESELGIIEEKKKVSGRLKINLGFIVYSIGTYAMVNVEREKFTIEFSQLIFDKLVDFFKKYNLEEVFNRLERMDTFFSIDHWFHEYEDGKAHFVDMSYIDRFYLLMTALLYKNGKNLKEIKTLDRFNKSQLETFKNEFKKAPSGQNRSVMFFSSCI